MASENEYQRPTRLRVNLVDPLVRFMIRRKLAPRSNTRDGGGFRILEVRGRKTGRRYQCPVFVEAIDSRRVIVSLWGESRWAQNLRAPAPDARLRFGNRLEPIEAHEMPNDDRKTAVMLALCRQNSSSFARLNFKVDPKRVTLEQAHELAARYPVFRIETRRLRAASG